MINTKSITFRLTLFFSTTSTFVLLIVGMLVGNLVESHFEELDLEELEGKLKLVRHALKNVRTPSNLTNIPLNLSDALIGHPDLSVAIRGPDHRRLFTTPNADFAAHLLKLPLVGDSFKKDKLVTWEEKGVIYRGISANVDLGVAEKSLAVVALAIDIEPHQTFMKTFYKDLWMAISTGVLITIFLGCIAARRGLAPVRKIAEVTKKISANHLSSRLELNSVPQELVDLVAAFNEMLARLEDSFDRLSDFSTDLAHELRTPISNLMTQTQVALSKTRTADEYREVLYSNLEEYERQSRMISDMLFLAKADNGLITPSREIVCLSKELSDLFGFYEAIADEQSITLTLTGEGYVSGDRLMLRRAFSNLLSNAIRHTPQGKAVKVFISQSKAQETNIIIENFGETIPLEHLPRLFDRFYRVDPSREKASDGAGLGLAITKSIIKAHQGNIQVFSSNGSTRFEATFPKI